MYQDTLEALLNVEPMSDNLKSQLNDLCRFSRDLGAQSERVSTLIKEYNWYEFSVCFYILYEKDSRDVHVAETL